MAVASPSGEGWDIYGSDTQRRRHNASSVDELLGRKPAAIPARLSRVLYIPQHGCSQFHLPLYDVSEEFKRAVGDTLIGSSLFTTKLAMMNTPSGEGTNGEVRFFVDLEKRKVGNSEEAIAKVQRRAMGDVDSEVIMSFLMEEGNDSFRLRRPTADSEHRDISVSASYPIADTTDRDTTIRHPYYSFLPPNSLGVQWQTHPKAYGPLRYTLAKKSPDQSAGELPHEEDVHAIFHHIWNSTLPLCSRQSQGVLILPADLDGELELLYIGSLIGLLWQVRRLGGRGDKEHKKSIPKGNRTGDEKSAKSFLKKMFMRE